MRLPFLALLALLALPCAPARGASVTSMSVQSHATDFIGKGVPRIAYPGGPQASAGPGDFGGIGMGARVGEEGVSFELAPPPGEALRPHNWTQADRYAFQDPGRPGMSVSAGSRACNAATGRVEVLDVAFDGAGAPTRLWAIFDHHCEGARQSAFGEVRWNAWVPEEAAHVTPAVLRWPELDSWWPAAPATVVYHGGSAVSAVRVTGDHAADFPVRSDGCTGRAGPCALVIDFIPTAAGARAGRLELVDAAGATHAVSLQGFLHGGVTRAEIDVLDGDVAAPPEDRGLHVYTPADSRFTGWEWSPNPVVELFVQDRDESHEWWNAELYAGGGAKIQPGSYPNGQGNAWGPGPGIHVQGGPAWCNQTASAFDVHSIAYMPDGTLRSLDTSFERRCYEDKRAAARGRWQHRAGDTAPLPGWLYPGPRPPIDVPPQASAPPAATPGPGPVAGEVPGATTAPAPAARVGGATFAGVAGATGTPAVPRSCRRPAGMSVWRGTARADRLTGSRRAEVILGRAGNDRIRAGAGDDCVYGGAGNDLLEGGPGRDLLDCGPGRRDRVRAGRGDRVRNCERRIKR